MFNFFTKSIKFSICDCEYQFSTNIIINSECVEIYLPLYVENLASEFTVHITPIYSGKIVSLNCSEVENNKFKVYGENAKFHWTVHGKRHDIEVEPNKDSVDVKGDGPYLYI